MNTWQVRLLTVLGTILLGSPILALAQEEDPAAQEPPNTALLAKEINEGRKQNAAQMINYSWNTRTSQRGRVGPALLYE